MITVMWKHGKSSYTKIDVGSVTWSGTENQAARALEFTIPWDPYDKTFNKQTPKIALGDLIKLIDGKNLLFLGVVTSRDKTAEIGTAKFSAYDFMHYLLRSTLSIKFDNTTPMAATKTLCGKIKLKTAKLQNPNVSIEKVVYKEKPIYDIIIAMYRKAFKVNKVKYMPVMVGSKLSVIKKGQTSGVTLVQGRDITSATYHDTTDNMVNFVTIYNANNTKAGTKQNAKLVKKYGYYMQAYTKKDDESSETTEAASKKLLVGITKEASVEAFGNTKCIAGRSIQIKDPATGIEGKFYISSDSHTFENSVHMMKLELKQSNTMETGAQQEKNKND